MKKTTMTLTVNPQDKETLMRGAKEQRESLSTFVVRSGLQRLKIIE